LCYLGLMQAADLAKLRAIFARHPQVQAVFLFGSRAFGKTRPDSDWDLAVYLEPPEPDPTLELLGALVAAGFDQVDLCCCTRPRRCWPSRWCGLTG